MRNIASNRAPSSALPLEPLEAALRSRGITVHYTTWMRLVRRKGLPAKKVGGRYYVALADLDAWIDAQRVAGGVPAPVPATAPRAMAPAAAEAVLQARRSSGRPPRLAPPDGAHNGGLR